MKIIVQKFGGTSVATTEARRHVLQHVRRELGNGYSVVIVVSAMGRKGDPYATDTLLSLLDSHKDPEQLRERDLLMSCGEIISAVKLSSELNAAGIPSVALTGAQAGIRTDNHFGQAKLLDIRPSTLMHLLQRQRVAVVAGFQGATAQGDFTTLGRGGSDTSAVALGAAIGAEMIDIYTDVSGLLTADPRLVNDATPIRAVSYAEIGNMARQGAQVVHPRAVELARQAKLPLRIRSTFDDNTGTLVSLAGAPAERLITGITTSGAITQLTIQSTIDDGDVQLQAFQTLARASISVDFINVTPAGATFTVHGSEEKRAVALLQQQGFSPLVCSDCAKIALIGGGMTGQPGVMARIIETLSEQGVAILQTVDSHTSIRVLVQESDMLLALRSLHACFDLHLN